MGNDFNMLTYAMVTILVIREVARQPNEIRFYHLIYRKANDTI